MGGYSTVTAYRFKTKKELIEEYGEDWNEEIEINPSGHMDYLLGNPFEPEDMSMQEFFDNGGCTIMNVNPNYKISKWTVTPKMITPMKKNLSVFAGGTSGEYDRRILLRKK